MGDLTPEELARTRLIVLKMRKDGMKDDVINTYLQRQQAGMDVEQVLSPKLRDYLRAAGMGAMLGFEDELAGAGAALVPGGKGYTEARDEVRQNYQAARAASPGKMIATEVAGAALPAIATAGMSTPAAGASALARAGAAMRGAGVIGMATGLGHSNEPTAQGQLTDAAVSGGASALTAGLLSGAGSTIAAAPSVAKGVARDLLPQWAKVGLSLAEKVRPVAAQAAPILEPEGADLTRSYITQIIREAQMPAREKSKILGLLFGGLVPQGVTQSKSLFNTGGK